MAEGGVERLRAGLPGAKPRPLRGSAAGGHAVTKTAMGAFQPAIKADSGLNPASESKTRLLTAAAVS